MNIGNFLKDELRFDSNANANEKTYFLNRFGSFLLSPARYLLNGKSVKCIKVPCRSKNQEFNPVEDRYIDFKERPKGMKNVFKTVISVLLFIPATILGSTIKGVALLASKSLNQSYREFARNEKTLNQVGRAANEIAVALHQGNPQKIKEQLNFLQDSGKLEEFLDFFVKEGNYAYLEEYGNLYKETYTGGNQSISCYAGPLDGTDRTQIVDNPRRVVEGSRLKKNAVIASLFKFYADGKIEDKEFFDKLKELNQLAREQNLFDFNNPQSKVMVENELSVNIEKVKSFLEEKGFFKSAEF